MTAQLQAARLHGAKGKRTACFFSAFFHSCQAKSISKAAGELSVVDDCDIEMGFVVRNDSRRMRSVGVTNDIGQRFLQDAVNRFAYVLRPRLF